MILIHFFSPYGGDIWNLQIISWKFFGGQIDGMNWSYKSNIYKPFKFLLEKAKSQS